MNNEVRERLKNLTRKLADSSFARANDDDTTEGEFEASLEELTHHLREVRRRSQELHEERVHA